MKQGNRDVVGKNNMFERTRLSNIELNNILKNSLKMTQDFENEFTMDRLLQRSCHNSICQKCVHFNGTNWCTLKSDHAYEVRNSLVSCDYFPQKKKKMNPEHYSTGWVNTRTGKSKVTHNEDKSHKRREKFKYYLNLMKSLVDSFRINDFYPLRVAFHGEKYELKKKVPKGNRGSSIKTNISTKEGDKNKSES